MSSSLASSGRSSDSGLAARALFGERLDVARSFAAMLAGSAVQRGLIGPREVPRLWDRHLLNCAAVAELVPAGSSVIDVGSGAGLPGLVLAIARPDLRITLLEPLQRRVTWLDETVNALKLSESVHVLRGRAESTDARGFDVATARAVASIDVLAGWCLPLLRPGGELLAIKGRSASTELAAAEPTLPSLGADRWSVQLCGVHELATPTTVIRISRRST
jgi:16S rRNA (guanine527-N7)-methyltransferase